MQWQENSNKFESNDALNGAWVILKSINYTGVHNYQLDINAERISCFKLGKNCSLEIFIAPFSSTEQLDIPGGKQAKTIYLLRTFTMLYDVRFSNSSKVDMQSFNFSHAGGVMLAMRARGIYGEIHNINLYYYYCQETIVGSVKFVRTNAPLRGIKRLVASCTNNALSKFNGSSFEGWCWFNGTWSFPKDAKCFCKRGYEALETGCIRK